MNHNKLIIHNLAINFNKNKTILCSNSPRISGKSFDIFGVELPGVLQQFHNFFSPGSDTYRSNRHHYRNNHFLKSLILSPGVPGRYSAAITYASFIKTVVICPKLSIFRPCLTVILSQIKSKNTDSDFQASEGIKIPPTIRERHIAY